MYANQQLDARARKRVPDAFDTRSNNTIYDDL